MSEGTSRSKRALLRGALFGTATLSAQALPDRWITPVVDTALLPAHAQATGATEFAGSVAGGIATRIGAMPELHAASDRGPRLLDTLVPRARAGSMSGSIVPSVFGIRIVSRNPDRVNVLVITDFGSEDISVFRRNNVEVNGFSNVPQVGNTQCIVGDSCRIRIDSIGEQITGRLEVNGAQESFTATPGTWPTPPALPDDCDVPS